MGCTSSSAKDVAVDAGRTSDATVPKLAPDAGGTQGGSSSSSDGGGAAPKLALSPGWSRASAAGDDTPVSARESDDDAAGKTVEKMTVTLRRGESGRLGLQLNDANRVVRTDWNSAATSAGVEPWDKITHVDGKRLKPGAKLQDAVGARDEVTLTLERLSEDELVARGAQTERNERLSI